MDSNESNYNPTRYHELSKEKLNDLFLPSNWNNLTKDDKRDVLQEVVNRDSIDRGMPYSPYVSFDNRMSSNELGSELNDQIELNEQLFGDGKVSIEYNGHIIEQNLEYSGFLAYQTVTHENDHAYWELVDQGEIEAPDIEQTKAMVANSDKFIFFENASGQDNLGRSYMNMARTDGDHYIYYFQPLENSAHFIGEEKVTELMNDLSQRHGEFADIQMEGFKEYLEVNGYQANLSAAKSYFNNENFVEDLSKAVTHAYYQDQVNVNPQMQRIVQENMSATLQEAMNTVNQTTPSITDENKINGPNTLETDEQNLSLNQMEGTSSDLEMDSDNKTLGVVNDQEGLQTEEMEGSGITNQILETPENYTGFEYDSFEQASELSQDYSNSEYDQSFGTEYDEGELSSDYSETYDFMDSDSNSVSQDDQGMDYSGGMEI